jgi:hypothetical protein
MYMVMLVIDDQSRLDEVTDAWLRVGIMGATVVESTGTHRIVQCKDRIHARFDFAQVGQACEEGNYTAFAIVTDERQARACLEAAEEVLGDLDEPHTGVFAAWPLALVKGVPGPSEPGG